jgi:hypothetical protein
MRKTNRKKEKWSALRQSPIDGMCSVRFLRVTVAASV